MEALFDYLLKSGISLTVFLLVYRLFLRNDTFFTFNRIFLLFGLLVSFIVPFITFTYTVIGPIQEVVNLNISNFTESSAVVSPSTFNLKYIIFAVYVIGLLITLTVDIIAGLKLVFLARKANIKKATTCKIVDNERVDSPFSVFNYVFINNRKLSDIEQDIILNHEMSHIKQIHWIDLLFGKCNYYNGSTLWFGIIIICKRKIMNFWLIELL